MGDEKPRNCNVAFLLPALPEPASEFTNVCHCQQVPLVQKYIADFYISTTAEAAQ